MVRAVSVDLERILEEAQVALYELAAARDFAEDGGEHWKVGNRRMEALSRIRNATEGLCSHAGRLLLSLGEAEEGPRAPIQQIVSKSGWRDTAVGVGRQGRAHPDLRSWTSPLEGRDLYGAKRKSEARNLPQTPQPPTEESDPRFLFETSGWSGQRSRWTSRGFPSLVAPQPTG